MSKFDPLTQEKRIQQKWSEKNIRKRIKKRNSGKEKFYFLQGPPYTSGKLHMGHAWNHTLKDMVLRFKRMQGFDVWDRAGYDMHGLPTEQKVMAKHNLQVTPQITEFGEETFAQECESFCQEMMQGMNEDLRRLGITLDFENAYQPITSTYIQGVWALVKKAHEQKRLYRGKRTMGWCVPYETALAKHEMEYKEVTDTSLYVGFAITENPHRKLVIWTTTPWTIPFNLAIMVNPSKMYCVLKDGEDEYIIAEDLKDSFSQVSQKTFECIDSFPGEQLAGLSYIHPLKDQIPAMQELDGKYEHLHTVLLSSEYVDTSDGTGLVHCAPGCGPEDYEVGHKHGLPPFNEVEPNGTFSEQMGEFTGKKAKTDDVFFIKAIHAANALVAKRKITHDYPFCERSKTPIIFRSTEQWFFRTEDLAQRMVELNKNVNWVPQTAKNAFNSWLENLRDNSITKQRFWGTPAPIWVNEKDPDDYIVVGSLKELESLAGSVPENLHKPYIDAVVIEQDGKTYRRIPDVLDVWIDSGTASWNCLDYLENPEQFEKWFPADFIVEGKDQIRGWFNLLMVASLIMFDKAPFTNVFLHGFLAGVDGQKMSKSLGNVISPYEIVDKYGADTLRLYMSKIRAGEDVSFSWDEIALQYRNISMLYNVAQFTFDILKNTDVSDDISVENLGVEEKYILSKLHSTTREITRAYESYNVHKVASHVEAFLYELSRTYIQLIRDKVQDETQKKIVAQTLHTCLKTCIQFAHPLIPFITDQIYEELSTYVPEETYEDSLLLCEWPIVQEQFIDEKREAELDVVMNIVQSILGAREKAQVSVRWPLAQVQIVLSDMAQDMFVQYENIIKQQTNIKRVEYISEFTDVTYTIKPNYRDLGKTFGEDTAQVAQYLSKLPEQEVQSLVQNIKQEHKTNIHISGKDYVVELRHIVIDEQTPSHIVPGSFSQGSLYLYTEQTQDLLQEGYARELTRRIQSLRKDMGLEKTQKILFAATLSEQLQKAFDAQKDIISQKCGIEKVVLNGDFEHESSGEIRGETFTIRAKVV
ncbi:MAG: isoleucine--tRNA ligase [Candidatus Woesearchaeota archaeon]